MSIFNLRPWQTTVVRHEGKPYDYTVMARAVPGGWLYEYHCGITGSVDATAFVPDPERSVGKLHSVSKIPRDQNYQRIKSAADVMVMRVPGGSLVEYFDDEELMVTSVVFVRGEYDADGGRAEDGRTEGRPGRRIPNRDGARVGQRNEDAGGQQDSKVAGEGGGEVPDMRR